MADTLYMLPTEEWMATQFPIALDNYFKDLKQAAWVKESNDCDDFSKLAAAFARVLHHNTKHKVRGTSLAVGEFYYKRDVGGQHAINFAVVRSKEGNIKVVFFEPQELKVVRLSKNEIYSCLNWLL